MSLLYDRKKRVYNSTMQKIIDKCHKSELELMSFPFKGGRKY